MRTILATLEGLPEALRSEYEERDGAYHLKLEGEPPAGFIKESAFSDTNAKLVQFRDNNRSLSTELESLRARFKDIDPEKYKALVEKVAELEKAGVSGGDDVAEKIQKAIANAVTPLQQQLAEISQREKVAKEALARRDVESRLTQAGLKAGVSEKAMPDYLTRGLSVFSVEEGELVARNGDTPLYSKVNHMEPLSVEEWLVGLSDDAPHLFKPSKGTGAGPGPGGDGGGKMYDPRSDEDFLANVEEIANAKMSPKPVA